MSKKYKDQQGDIWVEGESLWKCTTDLCLDRTLEDVEESFGPLTAVEGGSDLCGAGGTCILPKGHNMGRADIPENPLEFLTKPYPSFSKTVDPDGAVRYHSNSGPFTTGDNHSEDVDMGFIVPHKVLDKAQSASGEDFPDNVLEVYSEAYNVLLKKNADYGPSNIADSPGGPLNGILVRMWDKMSRLRHLVESGATPENESLRDTLMDMANYSLIAMTVLDGNWPGMEES